MLFRRRRKETINQETNSDTRRRRQGFFSPAKVEKRTERRAKRRAFFIKLTSNIKWIMLGLAVVAVIAYLWFGTGWIKGLL